MSSAVAQRHRVHAPGLPRLLGGLPHDGRPADLDTHLEHYGPAPHLRGDLVADVEQSGLGGRGGGGFPTGRKLAAVAAAGGRAVVVNAVEGEPASGKDRMLVRQVPHLVLDGAVLAAEAVGAREAIVAVGGSELELRALSAAITARARRRLDRRVELQPVAVPVSFVAGEETALVQFLDGGPAKPTFGPRHFERGLLVQNAETLAHLALVARFGPDWFREVGTRDEPGSALVSLSGTVARPGVYEIELGTPISELLRQAGGATEPPRAVLVGGYFGSWLDASVLDVPLLDAALAQYGASLGAGDRHTARRRLRDRRDGACGALPGGRERRAVRPLRPRARRDRERPRPARHGEG